MKKSVIVLTAICLICLTCVLCACGDKNSAQQAHEHSYTLVEADDPTCTESGNVLYYTCTCGKFFDSEKKEIEESQTVVTALGHDYEMTWTSADNETAQVVLTCRRDDTHVYQCSGTVVTDRTEATCDADGEIRYTVTIEYDDKTYADTHTQSIGKLDHHNYSTPTWTWDAQHTKATAHFVCADYSQHTLDVVDDEIDIQIVDSTCTQAGTKTYTASVEVYGQSYETTFEENISLKNHAYGENGTCENCGRIKDMLIFGTLQEGEGDTYYGKVSNATTSFSFRDEVTARSDTTYAVYTDAAHETAISLEAAPLNIGDNTFYILAEREGDERLFTVTIRRRPVYTVNFETSGSAVEQQSVEEDADITSPADTTKTGYTFEHWTLNGAQIEFPYKVENGVHCTEGYVVTITAVFNANNYTVTFNKNGGDLDESEASVTYDQPYKLPIPTREGHTFLGWYLDETQLTDEKGVPVSDKNWTYTEGKTVTAHWSANAYMLTVEKNIPYAGEATDGGTFTYGNEVTVTATTYLGYEFLGWYNEAEENVCQDETYTFAMGLAQTLTATYQVMSEMTDFEFTSDLSTCKITGVKNSEVSQITIPDFVTSIGDDVFNERKELQTVTIGNGVQSIGNYAFYGCAGLTEITIPDSVKSIGHHAFSTCAGLQTVTIGSGVTSIGSSAFAECTSITKVIASSLENLCNIAYGDDRANPLCAPNQWYSGKAKLYVKEDGGEKEVTGEINISVDITKIPRYAFYGLTGITSVTIPDSVESIGDEAFAGCTGLQTVTIGEKVASMGNSTFVGCNSLKAFSVAEGNSVYQSKDGVVYKKEDHSIYIVPPAIEGAVTILDGCTSITVGAFQSCAGLREITIPDSVGSIIYHAFYECTGLQTVTIGKGVTSIDDETFAGCTNLQTLTIGENVQSIGEGAFNGCTNITTATMPALAISCIPRDKLINVTITCGDIPEYAFQDCEGLQTLTIGEGVTSISENAFDNCRGITAATLPAKYINNIYKSELTTVTITSGEIPYEAFHSCTTLTTVTIGSGVTNIGSSAFEGCTSLTKVVVHSLKSWCEIEFGNDSANPVYCADGNAKLYLKENDEEKEVTGELNIPDGTTEIGDYVFYNYTAINSVTMPESVQSIGGRAFYRCTELKTVTIGEGVQSIGEYAFAYCSSLTTVNWNATNCTEAGSQHGSIFVGCKKLTTVYIADNVQTIPAYTFYECASLQTVTISRGVLSIGEHAFCDCTSLTTVNWNATNCTEAGSQYSSIFVGCTTLTTVYIGDNVQTIPAYTFYECPALQTVTIGEGVQSIGEFAFAYCTNLTTVNWNAINCTTAGSADEPIFYGCEQLTTLNIGDNVQSIPEHAFDGCENILEATLPAAVILNIPRYNLKAVTITSGDIPDNAFNGCEYLQTVTIGENVTSIGDRAFEGCTNITTATMPALAISSIRTDSLNTVTITCGYIQYDAFWGCPVLQTVTIGEGVIGIGQLAFGNCTSLTTVNWNAINCTIAGNFGNPIFKDCKQLATVNIADNVQSIPNFAFLYCTALSEIEIPGSVQSIGDCAFEGCTNLQTVTLCKGLQSIGEAAFCYCEKLSEIIIPNSVTSIGYSAFSGCAALSEIEIPGSVASINEGAFSGCASLQTVTIGEGVASINEGAFSGCASLQTVTIGENVTSIGDRAFEGCTALSEIEIPGSVTSIGGYAFSGCKGLKTVIIPASVTNIGEWAFDYCYQITEVNYSGTFEQWCEIDFGNNNANPLRVPENDVKFTCNGEVIDLTDLSIPEDITKIGSYVFSGLTDITSVTIPYGVTSIGAYAFSDCTGLKTVIIPASVTSIGEDAFVGCSSITEVNYSGTFEQWCEIDFGKNNANPLRVHENDVKFTCNGEAIVLTDLSIPEDITKIGSYVFSGLTDITSVTIPDGVTSIGDGAFESCINLKTVTIPASVTRIGANAFWYCTNIEAVNYSGTFKQWCEMDFGNSTANPLVFAKNTVVFTCNGVGIDLTDLSIPKDITKIGSYVFCRLRGITSITIPYGVTIIGEGAFEGCADLSEIDIPGSVTSIGDGAFAGCWNLSEIKIPDGVTSIGAGAFYGCTSLSVIEIPGSVTSIGDGAFEGCEDLKTVIIPAGVTIIGEGAFASCTGLSEIEIPGSVTSIGDEAFYGCEGLSEIKIPDSVQSIGYKAFYGCTSLHTVTIGKGMQRIDTEAFDYCENLKDIYYSGDEMQWELIWKGGYWDGMCDYQMHYGSTGPEAASDISAMTSELPILIASDRLDLWVKQDQIEC